MMGRRSSQSIGLNASLTALVSPVSLAAIAVLLINDHVLKHAWPSLLTGKLSDFAGLYFAPYVLLAVVFAVPFGAVRRSPLHVAWVTYLAIAAAFAALKLSDLTAGPLLGVASGLGFPLAIVADPSDLAALSVLPLSYAAWSSRLRVPVMRPRWFLRAGALTAAALSIVATSGPPQPSTNSMAIDVSGDVYAAVEYTKASDGVYRLEAGGTWRRVSPMPGQLIADPREDGSLYVLHSDIWAPTLDRIAADGAIARVGPPDRGPRPRSMVSYGPTVFAIARWEPSILYLGRNGSLLRSMDGGASWTDIGAPGEVQDIATSSEKGLLYVLTNRSLYRSKDGGERWTFMATVATASFAEPGGLAVHPHDASLVLVGSRKDLLRTTDGGTVMTTVYTDTGPGSADAGVWSVRFDPSDDDHVYAIFGRGCCALLESRDRGVTWSGTGIAATEIAVDALGNAYVVSGGRDAVLRRVGDEWVDVTNSLPVQRSR
jgi:hypothetical protein